MTVEKRNIYVVSDATGQTCERVVRATLVQFDVPDVQLRIWSYVRSPEAVDKAVDAAAEAGGIIIFSLVGKAERTRMVESAASKGVRAVDLLGPILNELTAFLQTGPKEIPGLFRELILDDRD